MKSDPNDNPWNVDADLNLRVADYAQRAHLTPGSVVKLAVSDFFFAFAEPWREALSAIAAVALMDFIGLGGVLTAIRKIASGTTQTAELPGNRWNFPELIHAIVTATVADTGIAYDELLLAALRDYLYRLLPPPQRQARATLVAVALTDYLEKREPPGPGAHSPFAAARRTDD